jgi:hypothetical protein
VLDGAATTIPDRRGKRESGCRHKHLKLPPPA